MFLQRGCDLHIVRVGVGSGKIQQPLAFPGDRGRLLAGEPRERLDQQGCGPPRPG